jgi:hypothetical protein
VQSLDAFHIYFRQNLLLLLVYVTGLVVNDCLHTVHHFRSSRAKCIDLFMDIGYEEVHYHLKWMTMPWHNHHHSSIGHACGEPMHAHHRDLQALALHLVN